MSFTKYPHGITSFGVPVYGGAPTFGMSSQSTIYFVDGTNGSDSNTGLEPSKAYATVGQAISSADAMDVIYVLPKAWTSGNLWLGSAYTECNTIAYAKYGLAIIGAGHQSLHGRPYDVVLKDNSTSAQLAVYAPMCAFENLAFERSSGTSGCIYVSGNTDGTYEAPLTTVYNCHFHGGRGSGTTGDTGGAVYIDGAWGATVSKCSFLGCLIGIAVKSNVSTTGNVVLTDNIFFSRLTTPSDISCDIYIYTQGSACAVVAYNLFAHLLPTGGYNKYLVIDTERQGLVAFNVMGNSAVLTVGPTDATGMSMPDSVGRGPNWCTSALCLDSE